eukprot:CAMPEP_0118827916 /NCGR_PEP_ID=MMETSP1162-20130426/15620_1 /TAXON_ID=33656 /ORGANISM="Phaeocystis Sp, Strain CCMP2710" /LENGTH=567 /DNA_ID=CAMNT_0006758793 /DNA_START=50 /DNA_END=1749 /DNA_ORIENTATION=+
MDLGFVKDGDSTLMFTLTPPQTKDAGIQVSKGCYCFVIDVSGSMNSAAEVTTDDGDRVSHGWSQLDISKHACNTIVSSLDENDHVAVITYSDNAKVILDWTRCEAGGKTHAMATIDSMRPERSTNLMAGLVSGFDMMKKVPGSNDDLQALSLNLIVCTDGMPSPQWHPARGRDGYAPLVAMLLKKLVGSRGVAARPQITTIGLGAQLDSELLMGFSDAFLHMPDPGCVGPFMVNMLAAQRCTARLPDAQGPAANDASLLLSPRSALAEVPGYKERAKEAKTASGEDALRLPLGAIRYDQPRHVLIELKQPISSGVGITATVELHGKAAFTATSDAAAPAPAPELLEAEKVRLRCADFIDGLAKAPRSSGEQPTHPPPPDAAPLRAYLEHVASGPAAQLDAVGALLETMRTEVLLGLGAEAWEKWGVHYCRTLAGMLRTERRSNFRDRALQHFGRDAAGREAMFEEESGAAEMTFATLKAPEPSLLQPQQPPVGVPFAAGAAVTGLPAPTAQPAQRLHVLPDEFMRGGGCFAPESLVSKVVNAGRRVGRRALDAGHAPRAAGEGEAQG